MTKAYIDSLSEGNDNAYMAIDSMDPPDFTDDKWELMQVDDSTEIGLMEFPPDPRLGVLIRLPKSDNSKETSVKDAYDFVIGKIARLEEIIRRTARQCGVLLEETPDNGFRNKFLASSDLYEQWWGNPVKRRLQEFIVGIRAQIPDIVISPMKRIDYDYDHAGELHPSTWDDFFRRA